MGLVVLLAEFWLEVGAPEEKVGVVGVSGTVF